LQRTKHFADPSVGGATKFGNCGRDFAKRQQSEAEFAEVLRMVIIDRVINTLLIFACSTVAIMAFN